MPELYPNRKHITSSFVSGSCTRIYFQNGNNAYMQNRIRELRNKADLSMDDLAERIGTTRATIMKLEKGAMQLTTTWMGRIANGLHCLPIDLISEDGTQMIQVAGIVGAGAEVFPFDNDSPGGGIEEVEAPPGVDPRNTIALKIKGESMLPFMPEGTIVYYSERFDGGCSEYVNKLCVVKLKDGPTLLKILKKGYTRGRYNLMSYNADMIEDAMLEWCAKIIFIKPI